MFASIGALFTIVFLVYMIMVCIYAVLLLVSYLTEKYIYENNKNKKETIDRTQPEKDYSNKENKFTT